MISAHDAGAVLLLAGVGAMLALWSITRGHTMIRLASPEATILALLKSRGTASAAEIGITCRMTAGDIRGA